MSNKAHPRSKKRNRVRQTRKRQPRGRTITTRQLLQRARRGRLTTEAYLILNGGLRATHWLTYVGKGLYVAEGIDGEEEHMTAREFGKAYAWAGTRPVWHID